MEEASVQAASQQAELTTALEAAEASLADARVRSEQQASRLSHLENEFEALQVTGCITQLMRQPAPTMSARPGTISGKIAYHFGRALCSTHQLTCGG